MAQRPEAQPSEPDDSVLVQRLHIWQIQAVRDLLFVAAVLGLVWAGYALRAVTVPLLVALLLAYLFEPLIEKLCRHPKVKRPHAVAAVLATAGIAVLALLAIALPLIIGQTTKFIDDVREGEFRAKVAQLGPYVPEAYADQFQTVLDLLPGEAGAASDGTNETDARTNDNKPGGAETDDAQEAPPNAQGPVNAALMSDEQFAQLKDELRAELLAELGPPSDDEPTADWLNIARGSAQAIFGVIGAIVQLGLVAFLIPFYFFFFSLWYPDVVKFGRELVPNKNREHTFELAAKMDRVVAGFVRGRIVISLIMGVMLAIGWMFCGVPYAIALGLVVGVFCAVPYLGVIGIPLAVGLLFFDQLGLTPEDRVWLGWLGVVLWPTSVFVFVQLIEGYVLTPMIAGKATNLDPVTIIVAVLAGGSVLGIYGMLLAIPVAACVKILCIEVLLPKIRAWTRGEAADPLPID